MVAPHGLRRFPAAFTVVKVPENRHLAIRLMVGDTNFHGTSNFRISPPVKQRFGSGSRLLLAGGPSAPCEKQILPFRFTLEPGFPPSNPDWDRSLKSISKLRVWTLLHDMELVLDSGSE